MESVFGAIVLAVLMVPILLIALWVRSARLKRRVEYLESELGQRHAMGDVVSKLTARVWSLEQTVEELRGSAPVAAVPAPPAELPAEAAPAAEPVEPPPAPVMVEFPEPLAASPEAEVEIPEPVATVSPRPPLSSPQPVARSSEEWEALVGGSWLNKLGAVVLVIGIALFLAYSATQLGPAGRVILALAVSLGLIAGGVILEGRQKYVIFARGLLGGGWAALYLTAYAMHALEAARVIQNPLSGAILLAAVALGMIAHSLRYRSQAVTGLAYFAAFGSLAITPVAAFSVIAIVPLAFSLLWIASRFEWFSMALFGLAATYGTAAYKATGTATVFESQAIVAAYWLLFEAFDVLRSARRRPAAGSVAWIGPLNALAALAMSYAKWSSTPGARVWIFFAGASAAYLAGALVRLWVRPPATLERDEPVERALSGYEGAITLAAALAIPAIFLGFTGFGINLALLAEAEILFLAGCSLRQDYLRRLALGVFFAALMKLSFVDLLSLDKTEFAGLRIYAWTPVALLTAALFYVNRALKRPGLEYSYGAAALVALIIGYETRPEYLGLAWLIFAVALFEFGFWTRLREFRLQSYGAGLLGSSVVIGWNAFGVQAHPWICLGGVALACYAVTGQVMAAARIPERERSAVRDASDGAATFFVAVLLAHVVPRDFLGLAWLALGAICLEAGLWLKVKWFRLEGDIYGCLGLVTLAWINVFAIDWMPAHFWGPLGGAGALAYAGAARLFLFARGEHRWRRDVALSAGSFMLAALFWYVLPGPLIAVSWAVMALLLIELGFALPFTTAVANGHLMAACTLGRLFFGNFVIQGRSLGISHRVLTVAPVAVLAYYLYGLTSRAKDRFARLYLWAPAILIVFLMRFELGRTMAVVGWAVCGLALLYFGIRRDLADLRWQSYALALWTFVRSWNTNFYAPESLLGMPARVLTGGIVIATFYIGEFLAPRGERLVSRVNPRTMFSVLATVLLTVLLFYEVSGSLLTVAWGIEGIALLLTGFLMRERSLRLAGLVLFLGCILKAFLYDLRALETVYRILSFIVLGLIMLGASWVYTRFREQLRQLL